MPRPVEHPREGQLGERQALVLINRLLAPLAVDYETDDIEVHPPLIEAERLRLEAIAYRDSMLLKGRPFGYVLERLRAFIVAQETPTQDFYAKEYGGATQAELDATRRQRRLIPG